MGDLAFGKSFDMLREGVKHYFLKSLHANMMMVGYLSHLPWIIPFFKLIPILNVEHFKFLDWLDARVDERRKVSFAVL
jgi:hypothetical protein